MLLSELMTVESALLWPESYVSDVELEALIAEDFQEIGASGRRFGRDYALRTLRNRRARTPREDWQRTDEQICQLQPALVLHTYRLHRGERSSMRSTIWRRTLGGGWQAVFHQGTPCQE
jgi:hypothetical protein